MILYWLLVPLYNLHVIWGDYCTFGSIIYTMFLFKILVNSSPPLIKPFAWHLDRWNRLIQFFRMCMNFLLFCMYLSFNLIVFVLVTCCSGLSPPSRPSETGPSPTPWSEFSSSWDSSPTTELLRSRPSKFNLHPTMFAEWRVLNFNYKTKFKSMPWIIHNTSFCFCLVLGLSSEIPILILLKILKC